jgi:hypothetical protein
MQHLYDQVPLLNHIYYEDPTLALPLLDEFRGADEDTVSSIGSGSIPDSQSVALQTPNEHKKRDRPPNTDSPASSSTSLFCNLSTIAMYLTNNREAQQYLIELPIIPQHHPLCILLVGVGSYEPDLENWKHSMPKRLVKNLAIHILHSTYPQAAICTQAEMSSTGGQLGHISCSISRRAADTIATSEHAPRTPYDLIFVDAQADSLTEKFLTAQAPAMANHRANNLISPATVIHFFHANASYEIPHTCAASPVETVSPEDNPWLCALTAAGHFINLCIGHQDFHPPHHPLSTTFPNAGGAARILSLPSSVTNVDPAEKGPESPANPTSPRKRKTGRRPYSTPETLEDPNP